VQQRVLRNLGVVRRSDSIPGSELPSGVRLIALQLLARSRTAGHGVSLRQAVMVADPGPAGTNGSCRHYLWRTGDASATGRRRGL